MRIGAALLVSACLLVTACGRPAGAPRVVARSRPSAYELRLGKQVYQRYCSGCHGDTGAGDGFNSFNLDPHPRDLGDPKFQKSKSNVDLADAIRRGGSGVGLTSLMPPWGRTLDDRHINAVVLYIRTFKR